MLTWITLTLALATCIALTRRRVTDRTNLLLAAGFLGVVFGVVATLLAEVSPVPTPLDSVLLAGQVAVGAFVVAAAVNAAVDLRSRRRSLKVQEPLHDEAAGQEKRQHCETEVGPAHESTRRRSRRPEQRFPQPRMAG